MLFISFKGITAGLPSPCTDGFTLYKGVCYKAFTTRKNWEKAEAECNKLPGGHLAAFHSREDFNVLIGLGSLNILCWFNSLKFWFSRSFYIFYMRSLDLDREKKASNSAVKFCPYNAAKISIKSILSEGMLNKPMVLTQKGWVARHLSLLVLIPPVYLFV